MDELDLSAFRYGGANFTGFRLVDRENSQLVRNVHTTWRRLGAEYRRYLPAGDMLELESLLALDMVSLAERGLGSVLADNPDLFRHTFRRGELYNAASSSRGVQCQLLATTVTSTEQLQQPRLQQRQQSSSQLHWAYGPAIYQHLRDVEFEGVTGRIQFDSQGYRSNFTLDVLEMSFNSRPKKIGSWNASDGTLTIYDDATNETRQLKSTHNITYIVTTIRSDPYLMDKDGGGFQGYCPDLLKLMRERFSHEFSFNYQLRLVGDGKYGAEGPDKKWNGMIGELMRNEADIAIAPLTITSDRERVIDFTKPFMNLGISIMIKKPEKQKPGVFSFMDPLHYYIWLCIVLSYVGVSLALAVVGRFSPYERQVDEGPSGPMVSSDFTLLNSLWFALGAFMQQGCDISPRSTSGRMVGSAWWFFTLIIVSTYTANLAAFLTIERMHVPISSAEDLTRQSVIKYGTLDAGSTKAFFQKSSLPTYSKMWQVMNSTPEVFVKTTDEGVERVRSSRGKYAFLLESTMNDYYNQRKPCNTMRVGEQLDSKGYGIAMPIGSELSHPVGLAVLHLRESGALATLAKKWWQDKGECVGDDQKSKTSSLTLSNVAGIFYILVSGLGFALVVAFFEFVWQSRNAAKLQKKAPIEL